MNRPRIVRADTLDLQDQNAPSAKDHTTQNSHPASEEGGIAPHQQLSIRHADQDSRSEITHGPIDEAIDYGDGIDMYDDDDDDLDEHGHGMGGGSSEDGDLTDGEGDDLLEDDMDKISSSPSIDDVDDIDFEFVYALHNFVATVEGQANAAKGDTMVLLDDSNTYWWLVRIVKDGSIGVLHDIVTTRIWLTLRRIPPSRAYRNTYGKLSATMLGDNSEKSKNPLKKAMRRRNAKTVAFTAPTYIEASDVEWFSDDESDAGGFYLDDEDTVGEADDIPEGHDEDIVVEPLRPKQQRDKEPEEHEDAQESPVIERHSPETQQPEEPMESEGETVLSSPQLTADSLTLADNTVNRSRNGTVRNTDSFFKDDTAEPKKISLTPNLLREENGASNESKEGRGSLEALEKTLTPDKKEDKKRKDKKPGMLSGLFKRKDKKNKAPEDEAEEQEKDSSEMSRSSPPPKASMDSVSSPESRNSSSSGPTRQSSKLQKQQPGSPTKKDPQYDSLAQDTTNVAEATAAPTAKGKPSQWIRKVVPEEADEEPVQSPRSRTSEETQETVSSPTSTASPVKVSSPVQANLTSVTSPIEANNKLWQDAFGERTPAQQTVTSPPQKPQPPQPVQDLGLQSRSLESPIDVSPLDTQTPGGATPGLEMDSSPGKQSDSPVSPPSSPGIDTSVPKTDEITSASSQTPTWSDASLRSYLDDDNDIRDLFIIVHDKSNVPPAGPDHPITGSLFKEESKRLKEMAGKLDDLLAEWVGRRSSSQPAK